MTEPLPFEGWTSETCRHQDSLTANCYDDDCLVCKRCNTHIHAPGRWESGNPAGGLIYVNDMTNVTGSLIPALAAHMARWRAETGRT